MKKRILGALGALLMVSAMPASADIISTYGDVDCFGTGGACVEDGSTWLPGAWGSAPVTEADDPAFTDRLINGGSPTWDHTFVAGAYSSATLIVRTAGIADIRGPYSVFADGVEVGQLPLDGFGHILVETFTFALDPSALLDGLLTVLIADIYSGDSWAIDYAAIDAESTASVPEPGTLALLGLGLMGMGYARRRKAA